MSLKYSKEVTCKGGLDEVSLQEGAAAARVDVDFGGEEKSSFFPLHVFITPLKCGGLCLGVLILALFIFFCYPWVGSPMFSI
jgi:hypothetical protein